MIKTKLKIFAAVSLIIIAIGIFYWQVTEAQSETVDLWGMADAKEININAKVSGRIVELLVDEGDEVKKGQLIARIGSDYQQPQQRQAQAALAAQYAQLQQLIIASQSTEGTLDANVKAAEAAVESAKSSLLQNQQNQAQIQAAREQAQALQSQLDSANVNLNETEIRAPFDGIITKKYVEEGSLISSSIPIYSLQK